MKRREVKTDSKTIRLSPQTHRRLKILAAELEVGINNLGEEIILGHLDNEEAVRAERVPTKGRTA